MKTTSTAPKTKKVSRAKKLKAIATKVADMLTSAAGGSPAVPKTAAGNPAKMPGEVPVVITSYSQPHVLQQRMREEKMTHGQRVVATVSPVRLESNFGKMVMYFCPTQGISIHEQLNAGDSGAIPQEVIIDGFAVPKSFKPGLYEMRNVILDSNGTMQVFAGEETEFIPA